MTHHHRRSKLDWFSQALLVVSFVLFIIAAVCYTASMIMFYTGEPGPSPTYSLTQIGNFAGIVGMIIMPLFIVTAIIGLTRSKETGKDFDEDHPEPGTAERS